MYAIWCVRVNVIKYIESKRMHLLILARANTRSSYEYSYEHLDMRYQYLYAQTGCIVTEAILANEEFYFKEIETIYHTNAEIKFFFQLKPASVDENMKEI